MLGEDLLVITSEFDRFDHSNTRLDIMALDKQGTLTIVELKRDASRTLADLQAIRYAAFCSNMTMADVVQQLARWKNCSENDASEMIVSFLEAEVLPEMDSQPRIILAAGEINDQELTSVVLWLRRFQVNISCVELSAYQLGELGRIVLVPRVLIPLPESREYLVNVERKEASRIHQERQDTGYQDLWRAVADAFNQLDCPFKASARRVSYMPLRINMPNVYYEWMVYKDRFFVGLHSKCSSQDESMARIAPVVQQWESLTQGIDLEKWAGKWGRKWGRKWAQAEFRLPYSSAMPIAEIADKAAETMKLLYDRTYPILVRDNSQIAATH